MPGLLGVVSRAADGGVAARFDTVQRHMRMGPRGLVETAIDPDGHWGIGRVHLGVLQPGRQLDDASRVRVLFHGDLHNASNLRKGLRDGDVAPVDSIPLLLAALYRHSGTAIAAQLVSRGNRD